MLDKNEGVALRATFIVDPDGVIRFAAVNDLSVGRNPAEVLRVLDALQTRRTVPLQLEQGRAGPAAGSLIRPAGGLRTVPGRCTFRRRIDMSMETLKTALPDYAKDIRLNLGSLAGEPSLTTSNAPGHSSPRRSLHATRR